MTTATATAEKQTTALVAPIANVGRELAFGNYDREQVELLKRTVAKGATDDQFALFMTIAQRRKLDPFVKQIWCVLRKNKDGSVEMAVQTAIDGFRLIAQRTGQYDGQSEPQWCGEDGAWKDVWLSNTPPLAARIAVYRKDVQRPFHGIAMLKSYASYKDDGKTLAAKWGQMPEHMLAKCAEALAFRKAFPEDMSGINTADEMDHVNAIDVPVVEKLALPPAVTAPEVDLWSPFLAELATAPGASDFAEAFGSAVTTWTEDEISEAWAKIIAHHETRKGLNEAIGPWASIVKRHGKLSTRVAKLEKSVGETYKARIDQLRAAEVAAQNGATP